MSLCVGVLCFIGFLPFVAYLGTVLGYEMHRRKVVRTILPWDNKEV